MSDQLISLAVKYIRAGDAFKARTILMNELKDDPNNEEAWLWLVQTMPTDVMRISALEQCLAYFPRSQRAIELLEGLTGQPLVSKTPVEPPELPPVPRFSPEEPVQVEPSDPLPTVPESKLPVEPGVVKESHPEAGENSLEPSILSRLYQSALEEPTLEEPADLGEELRDVHPEVEEESLEPSILSRLNQLEVDEPAPEEPVDVSKEIKEEAPVSGEPLVDTAVPSPDADETPPEQAGDLMAAQPQKRPRITRRSVLRTILIVFYAVVLVGGGYALIQRYGADILGWVKGLPRTIAGAVAPAGKPTVQVTQTSGSGPGGAGDSGSAPQPGLGEILYISERDGTSDLYVDHLNGSRPTLVIAAGSSSSKISDPAWSSDGLQIAFVRGEGQKTDLFTVGPDGRGLYAHTNDHAGNAHPSWAPDGNSIVFVSQRDGGQDLYILNLLNAGVTRLTEKDGNNTSPAWSPDGSRIAFVSDREGFLGLYLINPDGTGLLRLSNEAQSVSSPAWSPDSQLIAYASVTKTDRLLYVISKDGSSEQRITFNPGLDDHPAWSPDGAWIVFTSERRNAGQPTLFMVRSNGKGMYLFDTEARLDRSPAWSLVIKK